MSRKEQRQRIAYLENRLEVQGNDAKNWRNKFYDLGEEKEKAVSDLERTHEILLDAAYRDREAFLDNLLLLEPHLKHYQTDGKWDTERIHRAANHLRGEQALESVGYTHHEPDFSNVTFVEFGAPNPEGAA